MMRAYGKEIPTTLQTLVKPEHTALLIVDVQNDYWHEEDNKLFPDFLRRLRNTIEAAKETGVFLVYIQDTLLPGRKSDSAAWIRHYMASSALENPELVPEQAVEGTWGHQFVKDIAPDATSLVVKKFRSSGFVGTPLDLLLRSNNIKTCVITGVMTYGCVESTCRDASNEYFVVVLRDCVAAPKKDLHDACLKIMDYRYDTADSEEVIRIWRRAK
jgi:nicotinamidase-related amidase